MNSRKRWQNLLQKKRRRTPDSENAHQAECFLSPALNDGQTYRFHHMMKECAFRAFRTLDDSRQAFYYERYGAWYEKHGAYIHALSAYRRNQNFAAILRVVQKDAGILLASLKPEEVLEVLNRCPVSVLKRISACNSGSYEMHV